jgi:hypothetical protein
MCTQPTGISKFAYATVVSVPSRADQPSAIECATVVPNVRRSRWVDCVGGGS